MQTPGILSLLTFLPLAGAVLIMLLPRPRDLAQGHDGHEAAEVVQQPVDVARLLVNGFAIFFSGLVFLLSILLFVTFHLGAAHSVTGVVSNMQYVQDYRWIQLRPGRWVHYHMGVDGVSLLLVLLTTLLVFLSVLFSTEQKVRLKEFMVFLLLLETGMVGVFCALDLVLFYVFFEAMLIPMYFLIGIFGHENRIYAAIKFFLYTFAGSILMLVAIVAVYHVSGSFDITALTNQATGPGYALHRAGSTSLYWMFAAFALAFMIKVPMFPFHTWLPDAHVEAPTAGSVILAGVLLKIGTYGFIRICLPLFPDQALHSAPIFIVLAIVGIVYGSIVSAVQVDAKKLVAYSSVAHLGFVMLGIFTFTRIGMMGALVQNINHGISTPMLFFLVGMMYERRHTRLIKDFGGIKLVAPGLAAMLLLATLASIAVPFFNGFVGEFPILLGSWLSNTTRSLDGIWPTVAATTGMIWSAVYMLWWFQRLMLGPITKPANRRFPDLSRTEWAVLLPLAAMIFWIGLYSRFWTRRLDSSVEAVMPETQEQLADLPVSDVLSAASIRQEFAPHERSPLQVNHALYHGPRAPVTQGSSTPGGGPGRPATPGGSVRPGGPGIRRGAPAAGGVGPPGAQAPGGFAGPGAAARPGPRRTFGGAAGPGRPAGRATPGGAFRRPGNPGGGAGPAAAGPAAPGGSSR